MNLGLNPYKNYIAQDWLLWDGVAQFNHSRFLYPPIAGNFFQPLAKLPYDTAKHIWNYLNFIFIITGIFFWLKIFRFEKNIFIVLITGIFSFSFFPLYTLLERGQIDGLIFLLISAGIFSSINNKNILAGVLLAIASVFKFYCLLFIPFLFIKKKNKTIASLVFSFGVIVLLSYFLNGPSLVNDYIFNQLPRISEFAESGTEEMKINSWILKNYFSISRYSISMIDGHFWVSESISFFSKASFIKVITTIQEKIGLNFTSSVWSAVIYLMILTSGFKKFKSFNIENMGIMVLVIILICSPFTWVMNLVWLIPVSLILIKNIELRSFKNPAFVLLLFGLLFITIPDSYKTGNLIDGFLKSRYVIGELLILTGLLFLPKTSASELSKSSSISK